MKHWNLACILLACLSCACDRRVSSTADRAGGADAASLRDWAAGLDTPAVISLDTAESECTGCITLTIEALMGESTGRGYVVPTIWAVRDSMGRYWLNQEDEIKIFDSASQFVGFVGGVGEGPMEFRLPMPFHADSQGAVHIIDPVNARYTVVGSDLTLQSETRLPQSGGVKDAAALPISDAVAVNMWVTTADRIGHPIHIIRGSDILHSFGVSEATGPSNEFEALRIVATDELGRIITAERFEYDIEAWTTAGSQIADFSGPELNEHEVLPGFYNFDDNPIPNEIIDIEIDNAQRLWILSRRVVEDWQRHLVERPRSDGRIALRYRAGHTRDSVYFSRIDVVDLRRKAIVAHIDRRENLATFVGDGLVLENRMNEDGTPQIAIWRIGLAGGGD